MFTGLVESTGKVQFVRRVGEGMDLAVDVSGLGGALAIGESVSLSGCCTTVTRFAAGRDQRAFAEVIRRHGPMVMAAARRVLRHEQDAEDAFQATFLALARACCRLRRFSPSIYNLLIFQTVMDRG